jgi:hypothetical protein
VFSNGLGSDVIIGVGAPGSHWGWQPYNA